MRNMIARILVFLIALQSQAATVWIIHAYGQSRSNGAQQTGTSPGCSGVTTQGNLVYLYQSTQPPGYSTPTAPNLFPLQESLSSYYPSGANTGGGCSMSTAMADVITSIASKKIVVAHEGQDGASVTELAPQTGSNPCASPCWSVSPTGYGVRPDHIAAAALITAGGNTPVVAAMTWLQGEADAGGTSILNYNGTTTPATTYESDLAALRPALVTQSQTDLGQTFKPMFFIDQIATENLYGTFSSLPYIFATYSVAMQQGDITDNSGGSLQHSDQYVMIGPTYQYAYLSGAPHMYAGDNRAEGVKAGQVAAQVLNGTAWTALRPRSITLVGTTVKARFWVPVPPLKWNVLDTSACSSGPACYYPGDHTSTANGYLGLNTVKGFSWYDSTTSAYVTAATIVSNSGVYDEVDLTLNTAPTGSNQQLLYAYDGAAYNGTNPNTQPGQPATLSSGGNLADSDPFSDPYGAPGNVNFQNNYAIRFALPMGYTSSKSLAPDIGGTTPAVVALPIVGSRNIIGSKVVFP